MEVMFILSKKTIKFLISPIKEPSSTNNITMPITTDYDTFAQRYHGESPEIKKLKAENEKLKAENEKLKDKQIQYSSFIEDSGSCGDFEDYVKSEFGVDWINLF